MFFLPFGLLNGTQNHLQDTQHQIIKLILNLDGLQLFKKSQTEFLPI